MNKKYLYKALTIILVAIIVFACNDTLDELGFTQLPGQDRVTVSVDTIELSARTVLAESIFARTQFPVLGEYSDPVFGSIKSEYIGGFFLPRNAGFTEGANIDSVRVVLFYTNMLGDSLAPMELSVYRVNRSLANLPSMTGINPEDYADMSAPLGRRAFTGRSAQFTTEVIQVGMNFQTIRIYEVPVTLPRSIGEDFLAEYLSPNRGSFANNNLFNEFFPGLYFTTTFGSSAMISVSVTALFVHYSYLDVGGSSAGQDTIRTNALRLNITPEVTQVNRIRTNNEPLLLPNPERAFVKSPAGVNTELLFPLSEIKNRMDNEALNLANFSVFVMPDAMEDATIRLNPPNRLLLIQQDSLAGFFEQRRLPDNRTSFLSESFDNQTFSYRFNNISAMINHYSQEMAQLEDLYFYLIPVEVATTTVGASMWSPGQQVVTGVYNQMWPAAAILDGREGSLRVSMVFSRF